MQSNLFNNSKTPSSEKPHDCSSYTGFSALSSTYDDDDAGEDMVDDNNKQEALNTIFKPTYAQAAAKAAESKDA